MRLVWRVNQPLAEHLTGSIFERLKVVFMQCLINLHALDLRYLREGHHCNYNILLHVVGNSILAK